jgi:hypothetical protein
MLLKIANGTVYDPANGRAGGRALPSPRPRQVGLPGGAPGLRTKRKGGVSSPVEALPETAEDVPQRSPRANHSRQPVSCAGREVEGGRWSSELGPKVDIEHTTPEAVGGGAYGEPVVVLSRPIPSPAKPGRPDQHPKDEPPC